MLIATMLTSEITHFNVVDIQWHFYLSTSMILITIGQDTYIQHLSSHFSSVQKKWYINLYMGDHQHHLLGGKYKKIKWTAT